MTLTFHMSYRLWRDHGIWDSAAGRDTDCQPYRRIRHGIPNLYLSGGRSFSSVFMGSSSGFGGYTLTSALRTIAAARRCNSPGCSSRYLPTILLSCPIATPGGTNKKVPSYASETPETYPLKGTTRKCGLRPRVRFLPFQPICVQLL